MSINYRKLCQAYWFAMCVYLGIVVDHNLCNVFLAIASAIVAYWFARAIVHGKVRRIFTFTPVAVTLCQLSITVKKAVMDTGFKQALDDKPIGAFVGDVLYGFRHIALTVWDSVPAFGQALLHDKYDSVEALNYRFLTLAAAAIVLIYYLLRDKGAATQTQNGRVSQPA